MEETEQQLCAETGESGKGFNYNKLQAVICIVSSSIVSVALIAWAIKTFF